MTYVDYICRMAEISTVPRGVIVHGLALQDVVRKAHGEAGNVVVAPHVLREARECPPYGLEM